VEEEALKPSAVSGIENLVVEEVCQMDEAEVLNKVTSKSSAPPICTSSSTPTSIPFAPPPTNPNSGGGEGVSGIEKLVDECSGLLEVEEEEALKPSAVSGIENLVVLEEVCQMDETEVLNKVTSKSSAPPICTSSSTPTSIPFAPPPKST
jgi:hypothetical protein